MKHTTDQLSSITASSNVTSSPGLLPNPTWDSTGLAPAVMLSLTFVLGVPGNLAVIVLRPNWQRMSSLSHRLLLNLAVCDLLCLLTLPPWIYSFLHGWTFGLVACKLLAYVEYCNIYGSLLTVTGLSIQRYLVMVHRQSCQQIPENLVLTLLWLVAFILSTPSLVTYQIKAQLWPDCQATYSSDAQRVASLMTETAFGFISFVIVAFSYIRIKGTVNQAALFNHPQTTQLVTSIIATMFVLWAPFHTINVLSVAAICLKNEDLLIFCTEAKDIVASVTFINSCVNPLLYAFTSGQISAICWKKKPTTRRHSQTSHITTVAELCRNS